MGIRSVGGQTAVERFKPVTRTENSEPLKQSTAPVAQNQSISNDKKVPDFLVDLKKYELNNRLAQIQT